MEPELVNVPPQDIIRTQQPRMQRVLKKKARHAKSQRVHACMLTARSWHGGGFAAGIWIYIY